MIKKILLTILALAVTVTPTPLFAKAPPPTDETILTQIPKESSIEEELSLMALYFTEAELQVVEAPTRYPKPITQVAENVTIITRQEIERMNAHSLYEVFDRVPGVFTYYAPPEFNSMARMTLQGSRAEHVLVLLDGTRLNSFSTGEGDLITIPVQIVDRIEIIKGPASSSWGSAMGGVIHIFTKDAGRDTTPSGQAGVSYGEADSYEYWGDVNGKAGNIGYYLYAGRQDSDGLRYDRFLERDSVYSKLHVDLPQKYALDMSFGYSDPFFRYGDFPRSDVSADQVYRTTFTTANLTAPITDSFGINLGVRHFTFDWTQNQYFLAGGVVGWMAGAVKDDLYSSTNWQEDTTNIVLHATWKHGRQTVALGGELNRTTQVKETVWGTFIVDKGWGYPPREVVPTVSQETQAVYLNDTIRLGKLTVTPGIRYDYHSRAEEQVSPSIGATYMFSDHTLVRANYARGFLDPLLSYLAINDLSQTANPDLKPEKVESYQIGVETVAMKYLRAKATLFQHNVKDEWRDDSPWVNAQKSRRQGGEIEIETIPVHGFSASANTSYVHFDPRDGRENDSSTAANLILAYEGFDSVRAELSGHYVWWDFEHHVQNRVSVYDDPLWDLRLTKSWLPKWGKKIKGFLTVRNIFNGSQYNDRNYKNPERWIEGGVTFTY
ncbi:MAG: TonB-dependent receptor [Desulfobulbaceae bacterium]|nr:TonB-dependent receptor [Desulfobulbaceae bacterium]MCK5403775.1 TonB-dependent receptor [Desulfobulbaceae bacterium]